MQVQDESTRVWRPADTALLRASAAILIANSHLESFYPAHPWLAGDGLLGNALFYFLSGFGVALGSRSRDRGLLPWYGRRISRIYPSVILAVLVIQLGLMGCWRSFTPIDYFHSLIFPTSYPFVGHIMTVYLLLYFLLKAPGRAVYITVIGAITLVYIFYYATYIQTLPPNEPLSLGHCIWQVHYFYFSAIALLGGLFAHTVRRPTGGFLRDLLLLFITFTAYVAVKFVMVHGHYGRWFILLHLLTVANVLLILRVSAADQTRRFLSKIHPLGWLVTLIAGVTLEMYIMQSHVKDMPQILALHFPVNLIAFWIVTITGAVVLAKAAGFVRGEGWRGFQSRGKHIPPQ